MFETLSTTVAGGPWVLGAAFGYLVCGRRSAEKGINAIYAGTGGYFGYVLFAALMAVTDRLGYSVFSDTSYCIIILSSASAALLCIVSLTHSALHSLSQEKLRPVWAHLALNFLIFSVIVSQFTTTSLTFASGWDVIDFWGPIAAEIVGHQDHTNDFFKIESPRSLRHPATISYLLAWSSGSTAAFSIPTAGWPWFFMSVSCGLIAYGSSLSVGNTRLIAKLLFFCAITIPLVSNHVFGAGYAELFLATGLLAGSALIALYLGQGSVAALFAGLSSCISLLAIKNTGFAYGILPLTALAFVYFRTHITFFLYSALAALAVSILSLMLQAHYDAVFVVADLAYNFDEGYLAVAGKKLYFTVPTLGSLLNLLNASLFYNTSFNLTVTALVFCLILGDRRRIMDDPPSMFLWLVLFGGGCMAAFTLFTDYGFAHAVPENDTGHSRLLLPIIMCAQLALATTATQVTPNKARPSEGISI